MLEYISIKKPNIKVFTIDGNQDEDTVYNETLKILKENLSI